MENKDKDKYDLILEKLDQILEKLNKEKVTTFDEPKNPPPQPPVGP